MKTPKFLAQNKGFAIISYLANKGPSTEYRIRTGTKMFHSTVQKALDELVRTNLVRQLGGSKISGRYAKKYWLTFAGIIEFFHFLGRHPVLIDISRIRDTIMIFNSLDDYPIFRHWERLQRIYNLSVFQLFVDTGWLLVENPYPFFYNNEEGKSLLQSISRGQGAEVIERWNILPEEQLKLTFSLIFFSETGLDHKTTRAPDPLLEDYMKSVLASFRKSLESIKNHISKIENHWTKILGEV